MWKYSLLAFVFFCCQMQGKSVKYTVSEHPYTFSTYYEMHGEEGYVGRVIKKALSVRTCYALYNAEGYYEAEGVCSIGLGSLYPWAREINLYDAQGAPIGFIDGKFLTAAAAKYLIYNKEGNLVACAYLDRKIAGFNVVDSSEVERPLAFLKRRFSEGDWNVVVYSPEALDLRLVKIFSAFAVDYQEYF